MIKKKILVITSKGFDISWKKELTSLFGNIIVFSSDRKSEIIKKVKECTAMIGCPRYIFSEAEYKKFEHLDWIHAGGAGIENFLSKEFKKSRASFTNGKIIQGPEVADHAVALILGFTRNLFLIAKSHPILERPLELKDKKVLIIGLGGIGMCLAERLNSFGAKVDGITNDMPIMTNFIKNVYYEAKINNLANQYHIIACTAPLTTVTNSMLDFKFFKKMKKGSIFINVSRGKIVKTQDLLKDNLYKKFRGIGLDVTDPEPLEKKHIFYKAKNIFISPHVAGPSDMNRHRGYNLIKLNITRYLKQKSLINVVDKEKEY